MLRSQALYTLALLILSTYSVTYRIILTTCPKSCSSMYVWATGLMACHCKKIFSKSVRHAKGATESGFICLTLWILYFTVVCNYCLTSLWTKHFARVSLQISTVTTVHTTLLDRFPHIFRKSQKRRVMLLVFISTIGFLVGLAFTSQVRSVVLLVLFLDIVASFMH